MEKGDVYAIDDNNLEAQKNQPYNQFIDKIFSNSFL
jgi:hypothetical protein